ncbi:YibE/F family protein [Falsibacillus albus]|uniref:YibE/F family protein n=1 Tax=Falsibacillus albus TaxID=2478915 RepID=UPI001F31E4BB|nr:YibE/F family protein [Falsibacillus albus]
MNIFDNTIKKLTYKQIILYAVIGLCFAASVLFVYHNEAFYKRTIAEVAKTSVDGTKKVTDAHGNVDHLYTQRITAEITNGKEKGKRIDLTNKFSSSGAYDQAYRVGNKLFVSVDKQLNEHGDLTGSIIDVKRDKYVLVMAWIFIITLLLVGKKQGVLSIISLAVNASLMSYALDVYVHHSDMSLLWICGILVILFTVISLLLISGFNEKTYAAITATLLGIFLSLGIAYLVIASTTGLRYEEMQFLTRPYRLVFMAGLFVGSLGAVMDVAITISSSIFGLFEKNRSVPMKALRTSGMDIGKDVMGTLTNILFFVYASGSIPVIILYLKNGSSLDFTLSMNLSLEFARALAGGIGIVLTIPISVYTSIFFVKRKRNSL